MKEKETREFGSMAEVFKKIKQEYLKRGKQVWNSLEYDDRLALMCYVSEMLHRHAREGGTYRYLIYERMGFDLDAYTPLHLCGLMSIHNLISGMLSPEYYESCSDKDEKESEEEP